MLAIQSTFQDRDVRISTGVFIVQIGRQLSKSSLARFVRDHSFVGGLFIQISCGKSDLPYCVAIFPNFLLTIYWYGTGTYLPKYLIAVFKILIRFV